MAMVWLGPAVVRGRLRTPVLECLQCIVHAEIEEEYVQAYAAEALLRLQTFM
eukprot:SAG31_NODE_243_length_19342_cov_12.906459_17_plen_52_part_00